MKHAVTPPIIDTDDESPSGYVQYRVITQDADPGFFGIETRASDDETWDSMPVRLTSKLDALTYIEGLFIGIDLSRLL